MSVGVFLFAHVNDAVSHEVVEDACQLVGGGGNGLGRAQSSACARSFFSAGSSIGLASVTPCTLFSGGAFAATEAKLLLYSSTGQLLGSATAPFGDP